MIENAQSQSVDPQKIELTASKRSSIAVKHRTDNTRFEVPKSVSGGQSRFDPITGDWTIFAPHREARPNQFSANQWGPSLAVDCPFCAGEEHSTPAPTWVAKIQPDDSFKVIDLSRAGKQDTTPQQALSAQLEDWSVRVVPNKYPIVTSGSESKEKSCPQPSPSSPSQRSIQQRTNPLFESVELVGGHEVIIEYPCHVQSLSSLDHSEIKLMLFAYQQRLAYWRTQPGIAYISLFKNVGGDAGASLQHSHSQLIATDQIPGAVENINERMRSHQARTGCCLQCDIVRAELKEKVRIVAQTESLVAYCPFSSRLPMLLRVTTKKHIDCFDEISMDAIDELARLLKRMTGWLETLVPNASYNLLLHSRPPGARGERAAFHWSLEFFPRIARIAGFEWGSQCMINTVLPEVAAEKYRSCASAENPRRVL